MADFPTLSMRCVLLLLADDDRYEAHVEALERVGFGALCGAAGLDLAYSPTGRRIDAAVLDMRLGLDFVAAVAREIRHKERTPPIVAIADNVELPAALAGARMALLGGVHVLYRPYHERELASCVARAVLV